MNKILFSVLITISIFSQLHAGVAIYNAIQNGDTSALLAALRGGEKVLCSDFYLATELNDTACLHHLRRFNLKTPADGPCADENYLAWHAVEKGGLNTVRFWIERGFRADSACNSWGASALQLAIKQDRLELVPFLLSQCDILDNQDWQGETALHYACDMYNDSSRIKIVCALLTAGANPGIANINGATPLHVCALNGDTSAAKLLLQAGADIEAKDFAGKTPLIQAVQNRRFPSIVEFFLRSGANLSIIDTNGWTPFFHIVSSFRLWDNEKAGKRLNLSLFIPADTMIELRDKEGNTPLIAATAHGEGVPVEWLIKNGANINAANNKGLTALHFAALLNDSDMVCRLLSQGADPGKIDSAGRSPLHLLLSPDTLVRPLSDILFDSYFERFRRDSLHAVIAQLIKAGAPLNLLDTAGDSPLHLAVRTRSIDLISELLEAGAPVFVCNNSGLTPCEVMSIEDYYLLMPLFQRYNAPCDSVSEPPVWESPTFINTVRVSMLGLTNSPTVRISWTGSNDHCNEPRRSYPRFSFGFEPLSIAVPATFRILKDYGFSWYHSAADAVAFLIIKSIDKQFHDGHGGNIGAVIGQSLTWFIIASPLWGPPLLTNMSIDYGFEWFKISIGLNTDLYIWKKNALVLNPHISAKIAIPGNILIEAGMARALSRASAFVTSSPNGLFIRLGIGKP
jgi:ankyrin repeat protein